jgi:ATP-binding cassette subfamily C (CFTR/MRP) protein 1
VSSSIIGLSLSYALQVTGMLSWCVRQLSEAEVAMNAVERVHHFGTNLESEAPAIIEGNRPPEAWPSSGKLSIEGIDVRYREGLPLVLKNVSLEIASKMKVGLVGRTGSGKSTIANALFRVMELSAGKIVIDDIDISTIGLEDLRKGIAIIPQEPVLFSGNPLLLTLFTRFLSHQPRPILSIPRYRAMACHRPCKLKGKGRSRGRTRS